MRSTLHAPSSSAIPLAFHDVPGPNVPFPPMEAELVRELPSGDGWQYEPKWDGFRGVLENDGGELALWSRNERPLLRYFPELAPARRAAPAPLRPRRRDRDRPRRRARLRLDADAAPPGREPRPEARGRDPGDLHRLRPAALGRRASARAPARGAARRAAAPRRGLLDLAGDHGARRRDGLARPVRGDRPRRRRRQAARAAVPAGLTRGRRQGEGAQDRGLRRHRRALEAAAASGSRRCCSASTATTARSTTSARRRSARATTTRSRRACCRSSTRAPSAASRSRTAGAPTGSRRRALRHELVAEVRYDKVQGNRFRHGTKLIRFRPDKDPSQCTWREVRPARREGDPTVESLLELKGR